MDTDKLPLLKGMYNDVKQNEPYKSRYNKLKVVPVFKKIIWQTLQNEPLTNEHLTGLIHMFKHDCSEDNFDKYMGLNIADPVIRKQLSDEAYETDENGFTNAGKRAIQTLTKKELEKVKAFLLDAFKVNTVEEGVSLCKYFISKDIPIVTEGIYSPWLFYINPTVFPLINDGIKGFKSWVKLSKDYNENIQEFHLISNAIGEDNFGLVDALTTHITKEGMLNLSRILYLNDNRLFKISHGVFVKRADFAQSGIIKILEQNNWISLSRYTGKGAGALFENGLKIGDFVYLCYGGDKVICVGKVISDAKPFNEEHAALLDDDEEEWIYREIQPIYFPIDSNIADLKSYRSQTMPSGNSTFWEIKPSDLESLNDALFIPKFNLEILKNKETDTDKDDENDDFIEINNSIMTKNSILYGPPGTGKTFHSISYSVAIVENKNPEEIINEANIDRLSVKKRFDGYVDNGLIVFTTFHQSMSYEDFIEGIKPLPPEKDQDLKYDIEDGIFKTLCNNAESNWFSQKQKDANNVTFEDVFDELKEQWEAESDMKFGMKTEGKEFTVTGFSKKSIYFKKASGGEGHSLSINTLRDIYYKKRAAWGKGVGIYYPGIIEKLEGYVPVVDENPAKLNNYVLIIDEINRGNVSQIFGELITLLEDDKRIGAPEALKITLPYSGDQFAVPPNLFVIGTMNTADRSVEALDTALRRRFSFIPKMPEENKLVTTSDGIELSKLLQTINNRLSVLKDNDHTIGHAWLWNVTDLGSLKIVFRDKILPLLQEYFYNDFEKLGLVLGDAFFKKHEQINSNIFASFTGGNGLAGQYDQTWQYKLKSVDEITIADFKSLEKQNNQPASDEE